MAKRKQDLDYGAVPFVAKHGALTRKDDVIVIEDCDATIGGIATKQRARVTTQLATDRLYHHSPPLISFRQFDAANRYRSTALAAQMLQGMRIVNYEGTSGGQSSDHISDRAVQARAQIRAIESFVGKAGAALLISVVLLDESPRNFGMARGYGRTDGIGITRWVLDALADYYKIPK